jgi:hypothetical protein
MEVPLRNYKGVVIANAIVSQEDYESVVTLKWHRNTETNKRNDGTEVKKFYASTQCPFSNKQLRMHHYIMGKPAKSYVIDHIDGNGLNNQRSNLRIASLSLNSHNAQKIKSKQGHSKFIGVYLLKGRWMASARGIYLGMYDSENNAAKAYDIYVINHYGLHARHNKCLDPLQIDDVLTGKLLPFQRKPLQYPEGTTLCKNGMYKSKFKGTTIGFYGTAKESQESRLQHIAALKAHKLQEHNKQAITRTSDGIAFLPLRSKSGQIGEILVDDCKWHHLAQFMWSSRKGYAKTSKDKTTICMHKMLLDGDIIDHINNDKLDNRMKNLRKSDCYKNAHNRSKNVHAKEHIFHGIFRINEKFVAKIGFMNKNIYIGRFETPEEAARAYNKKAIELYGEYAKLNVVADVVA